MTETRKPRLLVVKYHQKAAHFPNLAVDGATNDGKALLDITKIVLIPMNRLLKVIENAAAAVKDGGPLKHLDVFTAEAFADAQFAIPAEFEGKSVYFCEKPLRDGFAAYAPFIRVRENGEVETGATDAETLPRPMGCYMAMYFQKEASAARQ